MPKGSEAMVVEHVDVETASRLLDVTPQAVRKHLKEKQVSTTKTKGRGGASGLAHLIPVEELPVEARILLALQQENVAEVDLTAYRDKFGDAGMERLLRIRDAAIEMRLLHRSEDAVRRRKEIAQELGVSHRRVYEWTELYQKEGLAGLMKDRAVR